MAKLRYALYTGWLSVPATDTLTASMSGLLRDILTDERFRVHGFQAQIANALGLGDPASIVLAKNVTTSAAEVSGSVAVTHGLLLSLQHRNQQAAGIGSTMNWVVMFPEPLDFDQNDSLNVAMTGTNTDAAAQVCWMRLVVIYEVG